MSIAPEMAGDKAVGNNIKMVRAQMPILYLVSVILKTSKSR